MKRTSSHVSPWAVRGLYVFALALVAMPCVDVGSTIWPLHPGDLGWRYGFLGLMAGYLQTPLLGVALAMAVAYWQEQAGMLRFTAALSALGALAVLVVMGVFVLDVLQMRGVRPDAEKATVLIGGVLQEVKYFFALAVLLPLAVGAWQTSGRLEKSQARSGSPGIVTGRAS